MKKLAVVYFGLPRNSSVCYPSVEENFYAQVPDGFRVESFYHFYQQAFVDNPRSGERGVLASENYQVFSGMKGELEMPGECLTSWPVSEIKRYGDVWKDEYRSFSNLIHQLNSLHRVTQQVRQYDPDAVIFLRPDLVYMDPFPTAAIRAVAAKTHAIYVPNWQWWNGLNDRFSMCGRGVYQAYGRRLEQALDYCGASGRPLHAERLLRYVMAQAGAKLHTLNVRAARVRINGEVVDEEFSSKRSMGRRENRYAHAMASFRSALDRFYFGSRQ